LLDQLLKIKNEGMLCVPGKIEQCEGGEGRQHRRQTLHSLFSQPEEYGPQLNNHHIYHTKILCPESYRVCALWIRIQEGRSGHEKEKRASYLDVLYAKSSIFSTVNL
jgi:hypothetical protein